MPRKRMISPEIWTDPKFVSLSDDTTRLLFIGLFSNANDYGKLRGEWWTVRSSIFVMNELSPNKIEVMLEELEKSDLITRYEVKGEKYIKLNNWEKHQTVSHPAKDQFPEPSSNPSSGASPEPVEKSPQQGKLSKGKLSKGNIGEGGGNPEEVKRQRKTYTSIELSKITTQLFNFWKQTLNHPKAILTKDRKSKIQARLKEGYTIEQAEEAIAGCSLSSFHMGDNKYGRVYDSIQLIFRNGDQIEQFIGIYEREINKLKKELDKLEGYERREILTPEGRKRMRELKEKLELSTYTKDTAFREENGRT